jgi:GntR family transcriptional regulator
MANEPPLYRRIADDLRKRIEQGALTPESDDPELITPGRQLPTELELRQRYDASRNTVREAVKWLTGLGLVVSRPGQGTFATRKLDPFLTRLSPNPETGTAGGGEEGSTYPSMVREQDRNAEASVPKVEVLKCPKPIATRLRIKPGDNVVLRHQKRSIDGTLWSLQTSYYPMEWVTKGATRLLIAENVEEGTVQYLADTLSLEQAGYRDWVTTRTPDENEQDVFGLPHDATVFEIFRAAFTSDKTVTRVTVTVYPADRNQIVYDYGTVPGLRYEQDPQ